MSRLQYLVRKDIGIFNVGLQHARVALHINTQNEANEQSETGSKHCASRAFASVVTHSVVDREFGTWFVVPISGPHDPNNNDPYFMIQNAQTLSFAYVPQGLHSSLADNSDLPHVSYRLPVNAGPGSATTFRIRFVTESETGLNMSGHIIYPADNPSMCWGLDASPRVDGDRDITLKPNSIEIPEPPWSTASGTFRKYVVGEGIPFDINTLWVFDRD